MAPLLALAVLHCGGPEPPMEPATPTVQPAPPPRPPRVRLEAREVDGALPPEAVKRTVDDALPTLNACFQRAMREQPKLKGRLDIDFLIDEAGEVAGVKGSADLPDPVVTCIIAAFRALRFPSPAEGTVVVAYAVEFLPGD